MNDELAPLSPSKALINGDTITEENVKDAINSALNELNKTNDNRKIDQILTNLFGLEKITKFAIAQLLYGYEKWWDETGQAEKRGDTFKDYFESVHSGNLVVMRRYITVWKYRDAGMFPSEAELLPVTYQQDIATKLLDEGYELTEEQWDSLIDSQNTGQLSKRIREIKGKEPTKASYLMYLERDGNVVCWHQDERFFVGFLKPPEQADTDLERRVLEKVRTRALNNLGLIEK